MKRGLIVALSSLLLLAATAVPAQESVAPKVLRYSFRVAETGFDPAQISDLYSRTVTANIFEAPLQFEAGASAMDAAAE